MSTIITPINQVISFPVTDWSQHARQAMIWLKPNDVKIVARKFKSAEITTLRLGRSILNFAVERINKAYFVGFQNVASAVRSINSNIDLGEAARILQLNVTRRIRSLLLRDRRGLGRLIRMKHDEIIMPTVEVRQQQNNVKPHFHGTTTADAVIESLSYPPPCQGELTFYNIRDSMWKNNIAELFDGVSNRPKAKNEASLESFTPQGQELDDYHFYIFIDGKKVLLHGVSGISSSNQRYIQHITLLPVKGFSTGGYGEWRKCTRAYLSRFIKGQKSLSI